MADMSLTDSVLLPKLVAVVLPNSALIYDWCVEGALMVGQKERLRTHLWLC